MNSSEGSAKGLRSEIRSKIARLGAASKTTGDRKAIGGRLHRSEALEGLRRKADRSGTFISRVTVMSKTAPDAEATESKRRPSAHDRLCEEHASIGRDLGVLAIAADALKTASLESQRAQVEEAHRLVAERIIPHLEAELALRRHLAFRDHRPVDEDPVTRDIEKLNTRLEELTSHMKAGPNGSTQSIREVLYDIRVLARSHFSEE